MKPTRANLHALAVLKNQLAIRPDYLPESTTTGKVHHGYGILCNFTNREACEETLFNLGFVPGESSGSFTQWVRRAEP